MGARVTIPRNRKRGRQLSSEAGERPAIARRRPAIGDPHHHPLRAAA